MATSIIIQIRPRRLEQLDRLLAAGRDSGDLVAVLLEAMRQIHGNDRLVLYDQNPDLLVPHAGSLPEPTRTRFIYMTPSVI